MAAVSPPTSTQRAVAANSARGGSPSRQARPELRTAQVEEEVLLVLEGTLHIAIDDETNQLGAGSVAHVPAGSLLRVSSGADGGSAWVTTTSGLTATTQDGTVITPPWAQ